jgi:4'-phosphopantetheinyl transferase
VWWATPVAPVAAARLVRLLDAAERDRLAHFRRATDRARYLTAHALTRLVLADTVGSSPARLQFDCTCRCGQQHGKPVLAGGPGFSLTYAGDIVGVAVYSGPVGLDVEWVRELDDLAGITRHVCSPTELARAGRGGSTAFFTAWTRKEALLKATGDGLFSSMSSITLGPSGVQEWIGDGAPSGPMWLRDLRTVPGYLAAVAGPGPTAPPVVEVDGDAVIAAL